MKKAFTLAEVLITLGIVGIVAAITIPTLIAGYQKKEAVNALKKMYSSLTQATKMYQAENNITYEEFDTSLSADEFMRTYILPYVKIIKTCNNKQECYGENKLFAIDRKHQIQVGSKIYVLSDGSFLWIVKHAGGIVFYFDLNGAKKPNYSGRDIFNFFLINNTTMGEWKGCETELGWLKSGLYPGAFSACFRPFTIYKREELLGTSVHRSCNKNAPQVNGDVGDACAALIMLDGWEIKKDYPW